MWCDAGVQAVSRLAVSALINLSDSPKAVGQMLKKKVTGALMDGLKVRIRANTPVASAVNSAFLCTQEADCKHKRLNVMLLSNLCQVPSGCQQVRRVGLRSA